MSSDEDEPLRKSSSVSTEHDMLVKTDQNCSKNSRKFKNRRFRPKPDENVEYTDNAVEDAKQNKL